MNKYEAIVVNDGHRYCIYRGFKSFDDAKRWIIERIKEREYATSDEVKATDFCFCAENVNLESKPFSVKCHGWTFQTRSI